MLRDSREYMLHDSICRRSGTGEGCLWRQRSEQREGVAGKTPRALGMFFIYISVRIIKGCTYVKVS